MLQKKAVIVCFMFVFWGYSIGCGNKHKTKEEHYPNGKLKAVYTYNDAGLLEGVVKTYYESGELKSEKPYQNNSETGIEKEYYKSGDLNQETNWKDGKIVGSKQYFESGKLLAEFNYKDGKLNGMIKEYYDSGKLAREGNFKDNKWEGLSKGYYESGKLKIEGNFKDGGPFSLTCYDDQGNEIQCSPDFLQD